MLNHIELLYIYIAHGRDIHLIKTGHVSIKYKKTYDTTTCSLIFKLEVVFSCYILIATRIKYSV